ncbi:hypothetical protein DMUE_3189 [Dictyocoela muelleri]|nr:hypothetical protein DMUE_3189 [Dictyocoela muelleri]
MHPGMSKFMDTIKNYIHILKLKRFIQYVCTSCKECKIEKETTPHYCLPENKSAQITFEIIGFDIKEPINSNYFKGCDENPYIYILLIVDLFSRYSEVEILFDINSDTICKTIHEKWLKRYKSPKLCLADNGKQFTSLKFSEFISNHGIKHITSAP